MLVLILAFCVLMSQYPFTERLGHEVLGVLSTCSGSRGSGVRLIAR
jgi:hypothetical protein